MKFIASSILSFFFIDASMAQPGGTRGGPGSREGNVGFQDKESAPGESGGRIFDDIFDGHKGHGEERRGPRGDDDRHRFFKLVGLGFLTKNHDGLTYGDFIKNITCPEVEDEPLCPLHPTLDGEERNGTWVCRSVYHPITGMLRNSSACIDPDYALESDECGCCEDVCPQICECGCNEEGDGKGGVLVQGPSIASPGEMVELCMPPGAAVSLVDAVDVVECVTSCAV